MELTEGFFFYYAPNPVFHSLNIQLLTGGLAPVIFSSGLYSLKTDYLQILQVIFTRKHFITKGNKNPFEAPLRSIPPASSCSALLSVLPPRLLHPQFYKDLCLFIVGRGFFLQWPTLSESEKNENQSN